MNYTEMTDAQINLKVFKEVFGQKILECDKDMTKLWINNKFDYCNSWVDAGPIIEQNKITLAFDGNEWQIAGESHHNPLRAAMIVFLMMREGKKNE